MVAPVLRGRGRLGAKYPSGSAGSAWRGLSLRSSSADTYGSQDALPYDVVLAQTDGIRSTGTHTFGAITVPTGAAGVVPVGMAGLWRLSMNQIVSNVSAEACEIDIVINDFDFFQPASLGDGAVSLTPPGVFNLVIAPFVLELAEGDVMWCDVLPTNGDVDVGHLATFLMEYVGTLPYEST